MPHQLKLYSTLGCHLCDDALDILKPLAAHYGLEIHVLDIIDNPQWLERYQIRIPVIQMNDCIEDLGWPFTLEQADIFLRAQLRLVESIKAD